MFKFIIYLQDLKEGVQSTIWQAVQRELLAQGDVDPRNEDESEEAFEQRLQEAADDYINRHNFGNEFCL